MEEVIHAAPFYREGRIRYDHFSEDRNRVYYDPNINKIGPSDPLDLDKPAMSESSTKVLKKNFGRKG